MPNLAGGILGGGNGGGGAPPADSSAWVSLGAWSALAETPGALVTGANVLDVGTIRVNDNSFTLSAAKGLFGDGTAGFWGFDLAEFVDGSADAAVATYDETAVVIQGLGLTDLDLFFGRQERVPGTFETFNYFGIAVEMASSAFFNMRNRGYENGSITASTAVFTYGAPAPTRLAIVYTGGYRNGYVCFDSGTVAADVTPGDLVNRGPAVGTGQMAAAFPNTDLWSDVGDIDQHHRMYARWAKGGADDPELHRVEVFGRNLTNR